MKFKNILRFRWFRRTKTEALPNLQLITNNVEVGLVLADGKGQLLDFNPAAVKLHDFADKEEVFSRIHEYPEIFELQYLEGGVVPFEHWPLIRILKGEKFNDFEVLLRRKDRDYQIFVSYSGTPIFENGELVMAVMNIQDITKAKKAEDELRKAIKARDEFLAIASHELKTPLTILSLQSTLQRQILKDKSSNETAVKGLNDLTRHVDKFTDRLNRLVEEMLDVSRIQNGKLTLKKEPVELASIIKKVLIQMQEHFIESGFEHPEFQGENVTGYWDALRLEQVITNLLSNSLRYGNKGKVIIRLQATYDEVEVQVQDQGIGISNENLERIFDRFERVNHNLHPSGLGLGLYISNQIILAHGGKLKVQSEINKGSTFIIKLPLMEAED